MTEKNIRKLIIVLFSAFILVLMITIFYPKITGKSWIDSDRIFIFEGVSGPDTVSVVPVAKTARWQDHDTGLNSRLAILLTDSSSSWIGLVHGLKTIGIPFRITDNVDEATKHKVVLVYPRLSGKTLDSNQITEITDYALSGGTLIGVNVLGGGMQSLFGFKSVKSSRDHHQLVLQDNHPVTQHLTDEDLKVVRFSTVQKNDASFGTNSYVEPKHPPLALYDDGTAAIVFNELDNSEIYAFGFDIGFYLLKAYNRRMGNVAPTYANGYESSVDNLLGLIKTIYHRHEPLAVTLGTVPEGKSLSVMLTHDIDYNRSLKNALTYAKHENLEKTSGTHFIQTKYIRDWNDEVFFDESSIAHIAKLESLGVELASHSVSHSRAFTGFELGSGDERYPEYNPYVQDQTTTYNGTILGELRVSKFLVERFAPKTKVVSFRPGHLSNPLALPEAMEVTGYLYSSSVTANVSLSHLPFRLNFNRDVTSEVGVFEFPITVEDELPPKMGERLDEAITLAHKIRRYGGIYVVLIHPNILGHKLDFQTGFVEAMKPYAWFGSMRQFGHWWSVRDGISADVEKQKDKTRLILAIPEDINGLVVNIPESWHLLSTSPKDLDAIQQENTVLLNSEQGKIELLFSQ